MSNVTVLIIMLSLLAVASLLFTIFVHKKDKE